jgi:hypothetical protein
MYSQLFAMLLATSAMAQGPSTKEKAQGPVYYINGKDVTKLAALKALIQDPSADVERCHAVELSDKLTMVNKKVKK